MANMVFVGGTGRSGTSIVKTILAKHPDAASLPFEYRFIIDPDGLVDFYSSFLAGWSPYWADKKIRRLEKFLLNLAHEPWYHSILSAILEKINPTGRTISPHTYHKWNLEKHFSGYTQAVRTLIGSLTGFSFNACWTGTTSYQIKPAIFYSSVRTREELVIILGQFVHEVISGFLEKENKSFFVEDNTWNILFARELLELAPQAKIVCVLRDPRDITASFLKQRWCPDDVTQAAIMVRDLLMRWDILKKQLPENSFTEIFLEDLVQSPKKSLSALCDFLEIHPNPQMLRTNLFHSNKGRYLQDFTQEEQKQVETIFADLPGKSINSN